MITYAKAQAVISSFPQNDITKKNLVYEGPLTWRITKDKSVGKLSSGSLFLGSLPWLKLWDRALIQKLLLDARGGVLTQLK